MLQNAYSCTESRSLGKLLKKKNSPLDNLIVEGMEFGLIEGRVTNFSFKIR